MSLGGLLLPAENEPPDFGFIDMLSNPDYADNEEYWYLSQESILEFFYVKWGSTIAELMKPTTDDKARLVGILFTDSKMRDFIPDLMGKSLGVEIPLSNILFNLVAQQVEAFPGHPEISTELPISKFIVKTLPAHSLSEQPLLYLHPANF